MPPSDINLQKRKLEDWYLPFRQKRASPCCLWEVTVQTYSSLLDGVAFSVCFNFLLRILCVAGKGQGTHKFLGRLGNAVIQCVDFVLPIFFFFFSEGEVIQKREETAELSYFLLSTTWLLLPFTKKFLVYFLGNIDFAMKYSYREQKQEW